MFDGCALDQPDLEAGLFRQRRLVGRLDVQGDGAFEHVAAKRLRRLREENRLAGKSLSYVVSAFRLRQGFGGPP